MKITFTITLLFLYLIGISQDSTPNIKDIPSEFEVGIHGNVSVSFDENLKNRAGFGIEFRSFWKSKSNIKFGLGLGINQSTIYIQKYYEETANFTTGIINGNINVSSFDVQTNLRVTISKSKGVYIEPNFYWMIQIKALLKGEITRLYKTEPYESKINMRNTFGPSLAFGKKIKISDKTIHLRVEYRHSFVPSKLKDDRGYGIKEINYNLLQLGFVYPF